MNAVKISFMNKKLHLTILAGIVSFAVSFAQETTYYIPGTGTTVKALDFESAASLTEKFNYGNGWAGTGFGLTGTQRGAPEIISVVANPYKVASSGNQVLSFRSIIRDDAWYLENPSAVGTAVYGVPDVPKNQDGGQDDFFMTGAGWTPTDTPSVMMHVYIPTYPDSEDIEDWVITSLRMPVKFMDVFVDDALYSSWPGIWCYGSFFHLRGPGRADIPMDTNAIGGGKDTWWTFGLSITPDGDIQYYATPSYVTELTVDHFLGSNRALSAEAAAASTRPQDFQFYPVAQNSDAIIMNSNLNTSALPTLIDNLLYTKGTTQVLSIPENEMASIAMYPNPTSDYLFVKGLTNKVAYKIYDGLGRVIEKGSIGANNDKINVNALSQGVYLLNLEGYKTRTFIKD